MTEEREQVSHGLGGRAALEAYRAARVAQRGDLRAALRANREALRAARILPPAKKTPEAAAMADAPAPLVTEAAPRSVFASLMEAERALAPPEPPPPTVADVPLPVEDDTTPAEEPMVAESPIADESSVADPIVAVPIVAEPVNDEPVFDEPVVDEPVAAEAAIDVTADAPAAIDLVAVAMTDLVAEATAPRAATDLSAIRELGPGMRHRLAQIGYRSCEDLAEANPAQLAQQLGEVSRLLRPESWIAAARAAID